MIDPPASKKVHGATEGRIEDALAYAKDAASLIERFLSLGNADPHNVYSMVYFYQNVANVTARCRHLDDAIRYLRRALEISQPVEKARTSEGSIYSVLADTLRQSATLRVRSRLGIVQLNFKSSRRRVDMRRCSSIWVLRSR